MPPPSPSELPLENPWSLAAARARELDADAPHRLWWAQGGVADADAPTVLVIHGGPGGRSRDEPLGWLVGAGVRWLCWDQRGCGRSQPAGAREHNDLQALLGDIDRLLSAAQVDRVAILAGSWGVVPALEYARTRPARVHGLMLRSAFLGSRDEVEAFFEPWALWLGDAGRQWLGHDTVSRSGALAGVDADGRVPPRLAWAWSEFEGHQARPGGVAASGARFQAPAQEPPSGDAVAGLEVQAHFLRHDCFLSADAREQWQQALGAASLGPTVLVHGSDDTVCPIASTEWLARLWPHAGVERVAGAGHRMGDARLAPRLREAAQAWCLRLLGNQP